MLLYFIHCKQDSIVTRILRIILISLVAITLVAWLISVLLTLSD